MSDQGAPEREQVPTTSDDEDPQQDSSAAEEDQHLPEEQGDEEAVARFRRSIEINRNHPRTHFWLAAALAHLGRLDERRSALHAGLALDPTFTIARNGWPSDNPRHRATWRRIRDGLRKVGMPEG